MSKTITVWITKYALTSGIVRKVVRVVDSAMCVTTEDRHTACFHGEEWQRTEAAAMARAEEMRVAKLKSLDKQIKKISALKFEVKP